MRLHLAQVAVITDVISDAVLFQIPPFHGQAGNFFDALKRLDDGAGVSLASTQVIDLTRAWSLPELKDETRNILRMDIVADLFALVAEDPILTTFQIALDQIAQETMQLDTGMIRPRQASSAQ